MAKFNRIGAGEKRVPTQEQVSAGGVAFRIVDGQIEIAIVLIVPEMRWQLPKGIVDEGESIETAASREVREEAGIETDLLTSIEKTEYWFFANQNGERIRYHKLVHWFLMRYRTGNVENHDHEVAEARWVNTGDALKLLVYKNEREVVEKAIMIVNRFDRP